MRAESRDRRRQLTSIEATVGDAIDLLDEGVGGGGLR